MPVTMTPLEYLLMHFDYAGQAIIDNDSIVDFLGKHYYNDAIDSVKGH